MEQLPFSPFHDALSGLQRYCKLPHHSGVGRVATHGDPTHPLAQLHRRIQEASGESVPEPSDQEFDASFLVPAAGNCLIFLRWPSKCPLSRNFGKGLTVSGQCPDGRFELTCPQYYVRVTSDSRETPGWAVAAPINGPAVIRYGASRPVVSVEAVINNFDFEYGNLREARGSVEAGESLRVEASGREVTFAWRKGRAHLRRLLDARLLRCTSLSTFSFAAWEGASEDELVQFAHHVASFCNYVVGQHTGVPVLTLLDDRGSPVKRFLGESVQSAFRNGSILQDLHLQDGLAKLVQQGFAEHVRMQSSELWRRLPPLCAAIEDPPYLEQKYATLMMAVELFIRGSLIEGGHLTAEEAEAKTLPQLIGAARGLPRWDIPKHYTEDDRYRETRNVVDHGNRLPHNPAQVRHDFDKWRLFLLRRLLLKLGYDGKVASPEGGFASSSAVDEFSEEHNSFEF